MSRRHNHESKQSECKNSDAKIAKHKIAKSHNSEFSKQLNYTCTIYKFLFLLFICNYIIT